MAGEMETVRVLRAFSIGGKRQEPEATIQVPKVFAAELVYVGKAEYAKTATQAPPVASAPRGQRKES